MKDLSISILNVDDVDSFLTKLENIQDKYTNNKKVDFCDIHIHFDVMDNKFVNNYGVNIENMKIVNRHGYYIDTHLMVEKPIQDGYIDKAIEYGSKDITIHYEIDNFEKNLNYLLEKKKENKYLKIGVALRPNTPLSVLDKYIDNIDKILVMSVEPGYGGQKYIDSTKEKLKEAKSKYSNKILQVDGGVNSKNLRYNTIADSIVIGSYITKDINKVEKKLDVINIINSIESLPKEADIEFEKRTLQIQEGGYGYGDTILGIRIPQVRKLANHWYKALTLDVLHVFISSNIHDYRRFAIFCLVKMVNSENKDEIKKFIDNNIKYINNWDLVDSCVPICIGKQLLEESDEKIYTTLREYTKSEDIWIKRIGIVSLLNIAKIGRKEAVFKVIDDVFYEEYHLLQKATGWILRELYKVNAKDTLNYLLDKKKKGKIPTILKSYATEKMSEKEKNSLK